MILVINGINVNNDLAMFDTLAQAGYAGALDRIHDTKAELDIRDHKFRQYAGISEEAVTNMLSELVDLGLKVELVADEY